MQTDISTHPDYARMVAETKAAQANAKLLKDMEAAEKQQLRAQEGKYLHQQLQDMLQEAEAKRLAYHEALGAIFKANLKYQELTGSPCPGFQEQIFSTTNLPHLTKPSWDAGFSTTRAAIMGFFASSGKSW